MYKRRNAANPLELKKHVKLLNSFLNNEFYNLYHNSLVELKCIICNEIFYIENKHLYKYTKDICKTCKLNDASNDASNNESNESFNASNLLNYLYDFFIEFISIYLYNDQI